MNIVVFDTETTSLQKPFTYNIGYKIVNTETRETLLRKEFVVEQVWENKELFCSAYYADKRPIYTNRMRARLIRKEKFGYITQEMIRDFKAYDINQAYAYNSPFDEGVFDFNSEWFKVINPFETLNIFDIRGYVHEFMAETEEYQNFCETHNELTDKGNYSTTAETVYRFISGKTDFDEEHTALADSEIETEILFACIDRGAEYGQNYKVRQSIERNVEKTLTIVQDGNEYPFSYRKRTNRGDKIYLKG